MLPPTRPLGRRSMARTPLAQRVEEAFASVVENRTTRRDLLKRTTAAGVVLAGASTMGRFANAAYAAGDVSVAVVGAGLAGLTCTYRLEQAGVNVTLYEAHPTRGGGRCWTIRAFAARQLAQTRGGAHC